MQSIFATLLVALVAAQMVISTAVLVMPVASFIGEGGSKMHVAWDDDHKSPVLNSADWGQINIYLATGSVDTQYKLQTLGTNITPGKQSTGTYTVDKTIGPNGDFYFIRMEGTKTGSNGYPVMSFSARFSLHGMTGNFNSTVMAAAQGTAPSGGPTSINSDGVYVSTSVNNNPSSSTKAMTATSASSMSTSVSSASTPSGSSLAASSKTSSAGRLERGIVAVAAGAVAVLGAMTLL